MKSPLPLLAIGAAFLLLKGKKGGESRFTGDNVFAVRADNALPLIQSPYVQVTSSYADVTVDDLHDVIRDIAAENQDIGFVIAGPAGVDRLTMAQHQTESVPDIFEITTLHPESDRAVVTGLGAPNVTLTDLQNKVAEAVAYLRAPYSPGA